MSASVTFVPLTITYTAANAGQTTATVLGQVLYNGATNWVPTGTSDNAIYLETSGSGPSTVLDGKTYYYSTGPAVPQQVTLSSASGAASATPSMTASTAASTTAGSQVSSSPAAGMSSAIGMASPTNNGGGSMTASSASASSTSSNVGTSNVGGSATLLVFLLSMLGLM